MMEKVFQLKTGNGLHARPAGVLVKALGSFQSQVEVEYNNKKVNAKSLMSLLTLGLPAQVDFIVRAQGSDASSVLEVFEKLIAADFKND